MSMKTHTEDKVIASTLCFVIALACAYGCIKSIILFFTTPLTGHNPGVLLWSVVAVLAGFLTITLITMGVSVWKKH
jgi:ABC-type transport system involved in multi-copper enzyme maturation permease subunit